MGTPGLRTNRTGMPLERRRERGLGGVKRAGAAAEGMAVRSSDSSEARRGFSGVTTRRTCAPFSVASAARRTCSGVTASYLSRSVLMAPGSPERVL